MPRWLRSYLRSCSLERHFWRALAIGALLRSTCAWFVYGPQALDDYKHGVYPAYQYFAGLPVELPAYRSHLLVWMLAGFTRLASHAGVESALGQVRAMYFGLGAVSLLAILGTYLYARTLRSPMAGALLLYMIAAYPLMPFIGTRAFGEAVATSFVVLAFGLLEHCRARKTQSLARWTLGFLCLGAGTLFRFHVGILFVTYAAIALVKRWKAALSGAVLAGMLTLAAEAAIDNWSGKWPFTTLFIYLKENEGGGAKYGVNPWYNTWALALVVAFAPFSFVLWRHLRSLWRRQWAVLLPWLGFVAAHSLAAHKEERFLYPIVGLEVWAVGLLWAGGALDRWAKKVFAPAMLGLGGVLLAAVCLVNSQEGEIEPPALIQRRYANSIYLDHQSLLGASRYLFYFLRPPSRLASIDATEMTAGRVESELASDPTRSAVVLITSDAAAKSRLEALENSQTGSGRCLTTQVSQSGIDRLLYGLNPKHNQRRRPTWYLVCERSSGG